MKVLCISSFLFTPECGATTSAITHVKMLRKFFGENEVVIFALAGQDDTSKRNYGKNCFIRCNRTSALLKTINLFSGYTGRINKSIENEIIEYIEKNQIQFVFVGDSIYGKTVKRIKSRVPNIKILSYYNDVKRSLCLEWICKKPYKFPVYVSMISNECLTQRYSDYNAVLNIREGKVYKQYYRQEPELYLPVILNTPTIQRPKDESFIILFVGGYYYPNLKGFDWFVNNVLPYITSEVKLQLVGNGMEKTREQYVMIPNIEVLGRVEDLSSIYSNANVVIGPIFEGAGMKVKTAEAFSYGKNFIGTDESLEGYKEKIAVDLKNNGVYICNTAQEYIDTINNNKTKFTKYNVNIREFFENNYSIEAALNLLNKLKL